MAATLVVLCTPVELVPVLVQHVIEVVGSQQPMVLTDVGSTKSVLVQTVEAQLREHGSNTISFVGGHPMAARTKPASAQRGQHYLKTPRAL